MKQLRVWLVVVAIALPVWALAQDEVSTGDLDAATKALETDLRGSYTTADPELSKLASLHRRTQRALDAAERAVVKARKDAGCWNWLGCMFPTQDEQAQLDSAKEMRNRAQSLFQASSAKYEEARGNRYRRTSAVASRAAGSGSIAQQLRATNLQLQELQLSTRFAEFRLDLADDDQRINALVSQLDESAMAAYMKDKMLSMLNSPAMCDAMKCPKDPANPSVSTRALDAVFNNKAPWRTEGTRNGTGTSEPLERADLPGQPPGQQQRTQPLAH